MKTFQKTLEQREKSELIVLIQQMLCQEPELQWLLKTPLPTAPLPKVSLDPDLYRQQVRTAMELGNQLRTYKRHEVKRRLLAMKTFADTFVKQQRYAAALTIYDILITEVITHFNTYPDESIAFVVILQSCVDGLDSCLAGEEHHQPTRLQAFHTLFAIYRFFTDHGMDLEEDIASLLVENATTQERATIAVWVQDARSVIGKRQMGGTSVSQHYHSLLAGLTKGGSR